MAQRTICLAKSRFPDARSQANFPVKKNVLDLDILPYNKLLKEKWSDLFFPATVLNETNYFICLQYTTKGPEEGNLTTEALTRHAKFIGFIESRMKSFL